MFWGVLFLVLYLQSHTKMFGGLSDPIGITPVEVASEDKLIPDIKNNDDIIKQRLNVQDLTQFGTSNKLKIANIVKEIDGGLLFSTSIGIPECNEENRGIFWFSASKEKFADQWLGCMKDESENYAWQVIR